jgi:predicted transcriptional regulator
MSDTVVSTEPNTRELTVEIVTAYLSANRADAGDLADIIRTVHDSLKGLGKSEEPASKTLQPAVPIKKSITPEYLVCLEDGRKLKMLKRHLRNVYNMSPEDYRAKWRLPDNYPMVAPRHAAVRSTLAKAFGLGRKRVPVPAPAPEQKPVRRGRKPKPAA